MNFFLLNEISTASILPAALLGVVRYKKALPVYRPLLWFIWIGTVNEAVSWVLIELNRNNVVNSNVYVLIEYVLLLSVFYHWNERAPRKRFLFLLAAGVLVWVTDNFLLNSLHTINSIFRVLYSIVILFLSINQVNKLIVYEKKNLIRNAMFLTCMAFIFFYSYKAFIETFYILQLPFSKLFYLNLFQILLFVNLFTNLVYAIAILCIPSKQEFSLRS